MMLSIDRQRGSFFSQKDEQVEYHYDDYDFFFRNVVCSSSSNLLLVSYFFLSSLTMSNFVLF